MNIIAQAQQWLAGLQLVQKTVQLTASIRILLTDVFSAVVSLTMRGVALFSTSANTAPVPVSLRLLTE